MWLAFELATKAWSGMRGARYVEAWHAFCKTLVRGVECAKRPRCGEVIVDR
jgi:hypothetical protein